MEISDRIIQSFFNHSCSPEEARQVSDYLMRHPEVAEKYITGCEWDSIPEVDHQPAEFWEEQWVKIERKRTKTKRLFSKMTRYAAAAMLILLTGAGMRYLFSAEPAVKDYVQQENIQRQFEVVENSHREVMLLTLADGTRVELMPASKISFQKNLEADRRVVDLSGEAIFQVAKDAHRPFTVNSGNVNTTALGTKFRVSYSAREGDVSVHLYEGKVLVQSLVNNKIEKAFLSPGQVLSFRAGAGKMAVDNDLHAPHFKKKPSLPTAQATQAQEREVANAPEGEQTKISVSIPTWYRFDKEWLPNVFDQLSDIYGAPILYNKEDVEKKYFIGKFEQTSSLAKILETIAEINGLRVEEKNNTFYIHKNK